MTVAQLIEKLQGLPDLHGLSVVVRDGRGQWRDAEVVAYNHAYNRFYIEEAIPEFAK